MKHVWRKGWPVWAWILLGLLPVGVWGQRDSVPHLVTGKFDWEGFKRELKAPPFQQHDMTIYVLRKDSLMDLISEEEDAGWMRDWHFVDVNGDRWLDAFYSGSTKARGGYHTYFMRAGAGMSYPIKLDAPGYVHLLKPDAKGLEFILREDAHEKGYLHRITEYYYFHAEDSLAIGWQLQMVSTTEVPALGSPRAFALQHPTQLRTSPKLLNVPPIDYDQDGKHEATGNVVAHLDAGLHGIRVAEKEADGKGWSFVVLLDSLSKVHVFQPQKGVRMAYAGWVLSEAMGGK